MKSINISDDIYCRLEKHITSFSDTPASVITNLLDYYENQNISLNIGNPSYINKDHSKYTFNGISDKKGRIVLEVVKHHIKNNETISYEQLIKAFPQELQGSLGVVLTVEKMTDRISSSSSPERAKKDYFSSDVIELSDGNKIVVTSQWGSTVGGFYAPTKKNFPKFIKHCKERLSYTITRDDGEFEQLGITPLLK